MKLAYCALVCGLFLGQSALASDFSKTVFFGDSLSDTGRIKDIVGQISPAFASALQPSFITNPDPAWTSVLATGYNTKADPHTLANTAGTNYAVGGARSGETVNWNGLISVPSTSEQIQSYLSAHQGKADPNALYTVWIGSNNLIAAAQTANPQAAIVKSANATFADIQTLHQAGAKHILVPNIPDIGLTPRAIFAEKVLGMTGMQNNARAAAQFYNNQLFTALNGSQANIIAANTFGLLQEVVKNPTAFGFKNTTGVACQMPARTTGADDPASTSLACTRANLTEADANETYLFADDIHPAGRTHRILAQYYRSIIDTPAMMARLPNHAIRQGVASRQQLERHLDGLQDGKSSVWLQADANQGKDEQNGTIPSLMIGASIAGKSGHFGVYGEHHSGDYQLASHTAADIDTNGVGVYYRHQKDGLGVQANAGVARLAVKTDRQVAWEGEARYHQARASGTKWQAGVQAGYQMSQGALSYRPYIGVHAQKVAIKDLLESSPTTATAMRFATQEQDSLQGVVGVNANYQLNDRLNVYGTLGYAKEFADQDRTINASLSSIGEYAKGFDTDIKNQKTSGAYGHLGVSANLTDSTVLTAGVSANHNDKDHQQVGGFVGIQSQF